jgi:L-lactate permease
LDLAALTPIIVLLLFLVWRRWSTSAAAPLEQENILWQFGLGSITLAMLIELHALP